MNKILKLIFIISFLFINQSSFAALTPNNFITPQIPTNGKVHFSSTDTPGTVRTLYVAGQNGSRCYSAYSTNADSVLHALTLQITNSGQGYGGTTIQTSASAGFGGSTTQSLMDATTWPGLPIDQYGNPYIQLIFGDTLTLTFGTSITGGTFINIVIICSDF